MEVRLKRLDTSSVPQSAPPPHNTQQTPLLALFLPPVVAGPVAAFNGLLQLPQKQL